MRSSFLRAASFMASMRTESPPAFTLASRNSRMDLPADLGGPAQLGFREEASLEAALLLGQAVVGLRRAGQLGLPLGQHRRTPQTGTGA